MKTNEIIETEQWDKEDRDAPHGRCEICHAPLEAEMDGADADGNRGRMVYYCTNENCSEGEKHE